MKSVCSRIWAYVLSYLLVTFRTRFRSHFDFLCFICRHSRFPVATQRQLCGWLAKLTTSPHSSQMKKVSHESSWAQSRTRANSPMADKWQHFFSAHITAHRKSQIYEHAQWHCFRRLRCVPCHQGKKILIDANWSHINIDFFCLCAFFFFGKRPRYCWVNRYE